MAFVPSSLASLAPGTVHIWRVPLDDPNGARAMLPLLSADERAQANRYHAEIHRVRYTVAHGWLRRVLARYVDAAPAALRFEAGPNGKPALVGPISPIAFNLAHSADLGLVAVAASGAVGVDVEAQSRAVEHLALAEHFFSPAERIALRRLSGDPAALTLGFFAAWSRKEAYLKATGDGITRGLHHFDVTLAPDEPARLIADRLDAGATDRWRLVSLDVAPGYSAALVASAPLHDVVLHDVRQLDGDCDG